MSTSTQNDFLEELTLYFGKDKVNAVLASEEYRSFQRSIDASVPASQLLEVTSRLSALGRAVSNAAAGLAMSPGLLKAMDQRINRLDETRGHLSSMSTGAEESKAPRATGNDTHAGVQFSDTWYYEEFLTGSPLPLGREPIRNEAIKGAELPPGWNAHQQIFLKACLRSEKEKLSNQTISYSIPSHPCGNEKHCQCAIRAQIAAEVKSAYKLELPEGWKLLRLVD